MCEATFVFHGVIWSTGHKNCDSSSFLRKQLMGIRHLEGLDLHDFAYGRSKAEKQWEPVASTPSLMEHPYSLSLNVTIPKLWILFYTAGYVEVTCALYWQKCVDFFPCFCRKVSFINQRLANNKNPRLFTGWRNTHSVFGYIVQRISLLLESSPRTADH